MPLECESCRKAGNYHDFQDKTYGQFIRVHNALSKAKVKSNRWRCTVCCNVKEDNVESK